MSPSQKQHRCHNHPSRSAKKQCSRCGKWVCEKCAVEKAKKYFCSLNCARPKAVLLKEKSSTAAVAVSRKPSLITFIHGLVTLLLVVFSFWIFSELQSQKRENQELINQNAQLAQRVVELQATENQISGKSEKRNDVVKITKANLPISTYEAALKPAKLTPLSLPYTVNNGSSSVKMVAITFDGGSYANAAGEIMDTLASRNVKSTFFVTGNFIRKYPEVLKRAAQEGHELGNHMMSHPRLTSYAQTKMQVTLPDVTLQTVIRELSKAEELLFSSTGLRFAPLWRAPYGEFNYEICNWAQQAGYLHIGWRQGRSWAENLDSNDWIPDEHTPGYKTPQQFMEKVLNQAQNSTQGLNGGIILMHLGTERKDRSQQVHLYLGQLIDSLRSTGYEVVTVSRMLEESGIDLNKLSNNHLANRTFE